MPGICPNTSGFIHRCKAMTKTSCLIVVPSLSVIQVHHHAILRLKNKKRGCDYSHPRKGEATACWVNLEDELRTDLTDTARCSRSGLTELSTVSIAHNSAGQEVRVVEDIEHLKAHVECDRFADLRVFLQT